MVRVRFALVALAMCFAAIPAADADHPIKDVTFDHKGGNEWWVQLQLGGDDRDWGHPQVRDTNGEWKTMTRPSWAPNPDFYVLSYHVEPGNLVQFRVENPGDLVVSCWYAHPSGEERCDGSEELRATFRPMPQPGRLRVAVEATQPLSSVAFDLGGGYVTMEKLSDGTWAYDAHVPQGIIHQFVAFSGSGTKDTQSFASPCYAWPSTTPVECPREYGAFAGWPYAFGDSTRNLAVKVRGPVGDPPAKVEVRYDGGDFIPLTYSHHDSYDVWYHNGAPSSGEHVAQFRVISGSGAVACQNDGWIWPPPTVPEQSSDVGDYDSPVFMHMKGNEHWVQTNVFAAWAELYAVEAQVNGGAWVPLQKQTWCEWARAMSAPAGGTVRFRAFTSDLSMHVTAPITWPPTSGGQAPTQPMEHETPTEPTPTFDATFRNAKGNEWWIQLTVEATGGTLANVDVRLNGGAWKPLANKGWGWAASYHAPAGTVVQFRATSTTGASEISGCLRWTVAVPTECTSGTTPTEPQPGAFDATFRNAKGNDWWLQVDVSATGGTLAGVDARVNGGAWTPLTKQSWGSWAKSVHAPAGSNVEFRARATDGASEVSPAYKWPPA